MNIKWLFLNACQSKKGLYSFNNGSVSFPRSKSPTDWLKDFTMSYSNQLKLSSLPKTPLRLWWEAWFLSYPHNRLELYQMGEKPAHSFSPLASKACVCVFGMRESVPQLTLSPCWVSGKVLVFKVCESLREGKKDLLQQLQQLVMVWGCQVFPEPLIYLLFSRHHSDKPTQSTLTTAFLFIQACSPSNTTSL